MLVVFYGIFTSFIILAKSMGNSANGVSSDFCAQKLGDLPTTYESR